MTIKNAKAIVYSIVILLTGSLLSNCSKITSAKSKL